MLRFCFPVYLLVVDATMLGLTAVCNASVVIHRSRLIFVFLMQGAIEGGATLSSHQITYNNDHQSHKSLIGQLAQYTLVNTHITDHAPESVTVR